MDKVELDRVKAGIELVIMYIEEEEAFEYFDPEVISTAALDVTEKMLEIKRRIKKISKEQQNGFVKSEIRRSLDYALKLKDHRALC